MEGNRGQPQLARFWAEGLYRRCLRTEKRNATENLLAAAVLDLHDAGLGLPPRCSAPTARSCPRTRPSPPVGHGCAAHGDLNLGDRRTPCFLVVNTATTDLPLAFVPRLPAALDGTDHETRTVPSRGWILLQPGSQHPDTGAASLLTRIHFYAFPAMMSNARAIAFHLPQYHPTPENDEWWGKGFSEWSPTPRRAKPLYPGRSQPHLPADLGYYDLRLPEARHAQAEKLAREYGIEGFCYYHYWFGGRRILERPVNEILSSGEPDLPFCLCWANHSWSNIWQGVADRMLIEQTYPGMDDHRRHFEWLLAAFHDPRYIRVDGKPMFLIYNPPDIPDVARVIGLLAPARRPGGASGIAPGRGRTYRGAQVDPADFGMDASTWQPLPPKSGHIPWRYPALKARMRMAKGNTS